jgi:hypothetical protein
LSLTEKGKGQAKRKDLERMRRNQSAKATHAKRKEGRTNLERHSAGEKE